MIWRKIVTLFFPLIYSIEQFITHERSVSELSTENNDFTFKIASNGDDLKVYRHFHIDSVVREKISRCGPFLKRC